MTPIIRTVLTDDEKFAFIAKVASWIEGWDLIDSCLVLNFGFESPVPWPQVLCAYELYSTS